MGIRLGPVFNLKGVLSAPARALLACRKLVCSGMSKISAFAGTQPASILPLFSILFQDGQHSEFFPGQILKATRVGERRGTAAICHLCMFEKTGWAVNDMPAVWSAAVTLTFVDNIAVLTFFRFADSGQVSEFLSGQVLSIFHSAAVLSVIVCRLFDMRCPLPNRIHPNWIKIHIFIKAINSFITCRRIYSKISHYILRQETFPHPQKCTQIFYSQVLTFWPFSLRVVRGRGLPFL